MPAPVDDDTPRPDLAMWRKFATWCLDYPALIGLFDYWLFRRGGYDATITGATRSVFRHFPLLALPIGVAVGGLWCHFFVSFPSASRNGPALALFLLGVPLGVSFVLRFLYG
jgi:hypothetical protein